jgi:hypothetical protein
MACSDEHPAPVRSNVFERTYQAKLAGCRYSGSRASTPESIPLPREKPRKAVASQNALRQAGMSGHEDSGPHLEQSRQSNQAGSSAYSRSFPEPERLLGLVMVGD